MASAGMEEPAEFDIVVKRGAEFSLPLVLEDANGPIDLTGFSCKSQMRSLPNESGVVMLEFQVQIVAAVSGSIRIYAAASSTAGISATYTPVPPQRFYPAYYDLMVAPSAATATQDKCYMQGVAKLYPRATVR